MGESIPERYQQLAFQQHIRELSFQRIVCCFGDDSHQRDARHSHHCEDRRDAETAHYVFTVLFNLNFKLKESNKIYGIKNQIHHSIWQQVVISGNGSTSPPSPCSLSHLHQWPCCRERSFPALEMTSCRSHVAADPQRYRRLTS